MSSWIDLHALWRIVLVGLVAGAGLPALFAVGLRALAAGRTPVTDRPGGGPAPVADGVRGSSPLGLAAAVVCFAVVLAAIGWGVYLIVQGT